MEGMTGEEGLETVEMEWEVEWLEGMDNERDCYEFRLVDEIFEVIKGFDPVLKWFPVLNGFKYGSK
jgi:hypothetical protein